MGNDVFLSNIVIIEKSYKEIQGNICPYFWAITFLREIILNSSNFKSSQKLKSTTYVIICAYIIEHNDNKNKILIKIDLLGISSKFI